MKIGRMFAALGLAGAMAAGTAIPAQAQSFGFSFGTGSGGYHHGWSGGHHWDDDDYWDGPRYRVHRPHHQRWRARARSGFSITINVSASHIRRCEARYKSYDRDTDMFLGYDGDWHRCRL